MPKISSVISHTPFKLLIPGYPEGSDITILNTSYIGIKKNEETEEFEKDYIMILFRDNVTGEKKAHIIYEPLYTFYQLSDEYQEPSYNLFFIEKEKCKPVTCKYSNILRCIAEVTGLKDFYNQNKADGNSAENRKLHTVPSIFMSDMKIEDYYRFLFGLSYKNEPFKLRKSFFDIEVDGRHALSDFPEPGECPINAIAYCDEANNVTYQFLLNDLKNPSLQDYRRLIAHRDIESELKDFVIKSVGGYKKATKFGLMNMRYKLVFFDSEIDLIKTMFEVINATCPDFLTIWNMAFDLNYIMARIENLGYNPVDIICDKRISQSFLKFYVDERNKNDFAERGDYVALSSYTVWLDDMISFASRRKGRGQYASFKLDAIGEDAAGVRKLDYSHITTDINMLPYIDFKTFSFYNVMDVIVQKCIEASTQDIDYVYTKCLVNNTSYSKCHRQSVYLANRFAKDFWSYGFIIGNNKNLWNEKPKIAFPGAAVGDPLHNDQKSLLLVNGLHTLISENDVDFDYSSLYPSIILENNLAPNTQIGRLIIEDESDPSRKFSLMEHQDMYTSDDDTAKYSRGGEFLENLMCANILEFCRRWLGLGGILEVIEDIKEFFRFNKYKNKGLTTGLTDGVYFVKDKMIDGIKFINDSEYSINKPGVTFHDDLKKDAFDRILKESQKEALM